MTVHLSDQNYVVKENKGIRVLQYSSMNTKVSVHRSIFFPGSAETAKGREGGKKDRAEKERVLDLQNGQKLFISVYIN